MAHHNAAAAADVARLDAVGVAAAGDVVSRCLQSGAGRTEVDRERETGVYRHANTYTVIVNFFLLDSIRDFDASATIFVGFVRVASV